MAKPRTPQARPPEGWRYDRLSGALLRSFSCRDERQAGRLIDAIAALREELPGHRPRLRLDRLGEGRVTACFTAPVTEADRAVALRINDLPAVRRLERGR